MIGKTECFYKNYRFFKSKSLNAPFHYNMRAIVLKYKHLSH